MVSEDPSTFSVIKKLVDLREPIPGLVGFSGGKVNDRNAYKDLSAGPVNFSVEIEKYQKEDNLSYEDSLIKFSKAHPDFDFNLGGE